MKGHFVSFFLLGLFGFQFISGKNQIFVLFLDLLDFSNVFLKRSSSVFSSVHVNVSSVLWLAYFDAFMSQSETEFCMLRTSRKKLKLLEIMRDV